MPPFASTNGFHQQPSPRVSPFTAALQGTQTRYGAASKFDFDNPKKWTTVSSIPVLDEHELTNESGADVGEVNADVLKEIAFNNNRRVVETGDPAPLTVGHTSDDPRAPEKPVVGYAVNYRVAPFRNGRTAIFVDYKVRKQHESVIEDFPRRSVELWLGKRELDPIALLGGTTPERDLGVIIRKARMAAFCLDRHAASGVTAHSRVADQGGTTIKYSKRFGTILRYSLDEPRRYNCGPKPMNRGDQMPMNNGFGGGSMNYADDESETNDLPPEDEGMGGGEGDTGEDPTVAAVFQSKQMKDLVSKVDQMFDAIMGGGGDQGAGAGMEPPGGAGMESATPPGAGGMGGQPGELPEAAEFHGQQPVRFDEDPSMYSLEDDQQQMYSATAFPGAGNVNVPSFVSHTPKPRPGPHKMNRTPARPQGRQQQVRNQGNDQVAKLQREVESYKRLTNQLVARNSRHDAEKLIRTLEEEGVVFGDTPEEHAKGRDEEVVMLARLTPADRAACVEVIRRRYKRRPADPATPAFPGVARYARPDASQGGDDEFDPKTPQEAQLYAQALQKFNMDAQQATKYMRSRNGSTPRR